MLVINLCGCQKDAKQSIDLYDQIKEKETFVVGVNKKLRPFTYINEAGELTGFDVDLIREISKKIFTTDDIIEFVQVTPSNRILKLNSKEVDVVISTMTITHERLHVVDFSEPYYISGQAVLVHQDSDIHSGKDLNGKNVGIVLGTTAATNIRYVASSAHIKGFKNYKEAFKELQKGNLDALTADDVILQGIIVENEGYKILNDRYSTEIYGIALRKDSSSESLRIAINNALHELKKTGKIKELEKKYNINYKR